MKKILIVILIVFSLISCVYAEQAVIDDPTAGLQWVKAPDIDINWDDANAYVKNLNIAGGGWRLPRRAELKSVFSRLSFFSGKKVFINSGWLVWSSELEPLPGDSMWVVDFRDGSEGLDAPYDTPNCRVLAVRFRR